MRDFLRTTLIGGLGVLLPITILLFLIAWLVGLMQSGIEPLVLLIMSKSALQKTLATTIAVVALIALCFAVGLVVKTRIGAFFMGCLDKLLLSKIPGYSTIKETVGQFLEAKSMPLKQVVLAQPFADGVWMTGFMTAEHESGHCTVFVPTGPNPTSGLIFHLPRERVQILDELQAQTVMRTIIGCGAGSDGVFANVKW